MGKEHEQTANKRNKYTQSYDMIVHENIKV